MDSNKGSVMVEEAGDKEEFIFLRDAFSARMDSNWEIKLKFICVNSFTFASKEAILSAVNQT